MTFQRPHVDGLLLAELIAAAPGRVRKRLDQTPEAALAWEWKQQNEIWLIECGEETVTFQTEQNTVSSSTGVACSCLLSPKCFHILACVSVLSAASPEPTGGTNEPPGEDDDPQPRGDALRSPRAPFAEAAASAEIEVTAERREGARLVQAAVSAVLIAGAKHAGLLLQSALLRGGHSCRSAGMVQLGNTVLRIHEGVQRLRNEADTADGNQLAEDLALALELSHTTLHATTVPLWVVGQTRRSFHPIGVRKLEGIFAEPILTLSGYSGVAVYLQEASGQLTRGAIPELYTVNALRTGDSQLVHQAYRGGIEIGSLTIEASEICRRNLSVQGLSASSDGRLAKGQSTRWAAASPVPDPCRLQGGRFGLPLDEQIQNVFGAAWIAKERRPAGWDLVAFDAQVLGPDDLGLLVHVPMLNSKCRLRIATDNPELAYRENLQLLARCPGLGMRCLGRLKLASVGEFDLLAVANGSPDSSAEPPPIGPDFDSPPSSRVMPGFNMPERWEGLCNTGLDNLQRHHLQGIQRWSEEVVLEAGQDRTVALNDGLSSLRRRLVGIALGGLESVPGVGSAAHHRDLKHLRAGYQLTAAQLVEDLAVAAAQDRNTAVIRGTERHRVSAAFHEAYLACHVYVREATLQFQRAAWMSLIENE